MTEELTTSPPAPVVPPARRKHWLLPAVAVASLAVGLGIGLTAGHSSSSTPQSCIDALDSAQTGFEIAADSLTAAGDSLQALPDALEAVQNNDSAAISAVTTRITGNNNKLDSLTARIAGLAPSFRSQDNQCRNP